MDNSELLGLLLVLVGGIATGLIGRLQKTRDFLKRTSLMILAGSAFVAGALMYGRDEVTDVWSLGLGVIFAWIAFGLGFSVTRPR